MKQGIVGMGKSYFIGESAQQCIKLDLFYTDSFILPALKDEDFDPICLKHKYWELIKLDIQEKMENLLNSAYNTTFKLNPPDQPQPCDLVHQKRRRHHVFKSGEE